MGPVDAVGELLERQSALGRMRAQDVDGLLTLAVGRTGRG
jgi:hypothetical protein